MNTHEMNDKKTPRSAMYDATRKILLAGIGAAALAQDEVMAFVEKLVDRGEMAEADARNLVREVMDRREKLEKERRMKTAAEVQPAAATRADIEALNARIAELTRQIEELRKK